MTTFKPSDEVDFVVIGAGAAGGVMAKELSSAGMKVVVLEQGPHLRLQDYEKRDELAYNNGTPSLLVDYNLQPQTFRQTDKDQSVRAGSISYGRCVGGGTLHYTGSSWRFHDVDFQERSRWGEMSGTGLADWPITYDELEPYYTKVEWEVGYSGAGRDNARRSKPYPVPAFPIKAAGVLFEQGAKKLGWSTVAVPLAILSKPYQGRKACINCGFCQGYGCPVDARSSTANTMIPAAEKTGRCEIRTGSYVREISVNDAGRVTGVVYFDPQKREVFQKAKAVAVCGNATETARLLLMSKSKRFPNGLANSSGLVGKHLMFGGNASARGIFEHPLNEYKGVATTLATEQFYDSDPKRGFYGGAHLDSRGPNEPIAFGLGGLLPNRPRWGAGYKKALANDFTRTMSISAFVTSIPLASNAIDLDPELKDAWGLPAMRVTYKVHPDDLKARQFMTDRAVELLQAAGAKEVYGSPVREVRGGGHLMGTARMGNDPKTSVVNKFHRAHDVPNLYCVDGSSFVTSGRAHLTCTIEALAFRAADYIVRSRGTSGTGGF
jgi:choline dehydrogenase-like flavoprotein